ncbi:GGDEF domain-containing protein [Halopseudomonas nanhaiensis]|uniref:GGDEF domain-containing protein n=1 Tax=Halopseudomonas nanhaiensis TaxID=2830842 RepID=UPI001CBB929E|nr:GGDEF domain-containing protein [Halopseudomonas nanhaiensis]UAW99311.1 GGDEF domain-containing protein [Halopseudomonas nanhaiensis]
MTAKDSRESRNQALRLQRFYLAQVSYLITYSVIAVAWLVDQYNGQLWHAASHVVLGVVTQAIFFGMFLTGQNLRFRDPSLTSPQIAVATILLTYLLFQTSDIRGSLLMLYPLSLLFGVFMLSMRAFIMHAAFALACYSVLLAWEITAGSHARELSASLLEWFILACFLTWLCLFGSYVRELQERLQRRHQTLQVHQETLKGMMGQLQSLAATDALTGLANRRYFLNEAERRIQLLRPPRTLGLALIDLDHFKRINDRFGHATGDEVLRGFSELARANLRGDDLIARFGGEEFILILGNSDMATLTHCLDRIREAFSTMRFPGLPEDMCCTLSAGLCLIYADSDLEKCIQQADQALYVAKENGRNRCEAHDPAHA